MKPPQPDTPECQPVALVADARDALRAMISEALGTAGIATVEVRDGLEAWSQIARRSPHAVVAGTELPGLSGFELLSRVRATAITPFVIHATSTHSRTIVQAIRRGADDFFVVPESLAPLVSRVQCLVESHLRLSARSRLEQAIVGRVPAMARLKERLAALSSLRVPVLIAGEGGSGRDHAATSLVAASATPGPPIAVVRRSRPPSSRDTGRVVYLDGVDRLDPVDQAAWHREVQRSERGEREGPDRIVASTSADIAALAGEGRFHRGLADRLLQFSVSLPPLRARRDDLPLLSRHLARVVARDLGRPAIALRDSALRALRTESSWPGNVRQLRATLERLVAFSVDGVITRREVSSVLADAPAGIEGMRRSAEQRQRSELVALLDLTGGNLAEAARRLGMSRGAVIYRAQKFGLLPERRS